MRPRHGRFPVRPRGQGSAVPGRLQHSGQRLSGHRDQRDHPYPRRTTGRRHDRAFVPRQRPRFPARLLHKLLDPFFTTKDHGTGLGLPIVNTIITSHNGKLLLTNPEEGGAMITICSRLQRAGYRRHSRKDERPAASADDEPVTLTDPLPSVETRFAGRRRLSADTLDRQGYSHERQGASAAD